MVVTVAGLVAPAGLVAGTTTLDWLLSGLAGLGVSLGSNLDRGRRSSSSGRRRSSSGKLGVMCSQVC